VAGMGIKKAMCRLLVGYPYGKRQLRKLGIDEGKLLRCILKK